MITCPECEGDGVVEERLMEDKRWLRGHGRPRNVANTCRWQICHTNIAIIQRMVPQAISLGNNATFKVEHIVGLPEVAFVCVNPDFIAMNTKPDPGDDPLPPEVLKQITKVKVDIGICEICPLWEAGRGDRDAK